VNLSTPAKASAETTPCAFVIFGVAGDLARRKLLPALFELSAKGRLHEGTVIVGVARRDYDDETFRTEVASALEEFHKAGCTATPDWAAFSHRLHFCGFDLQDTAGYRRLRERLSEFGEDPRVADQAVFYLSIPPEVFSGVIDHLDEADLTRGSETADDGWPRIVVEKPFGRDLASSRSLNDRLLASFDEQRIYRIDHYLGKETVQNLLVFRFGNTIFESVWHRGAIDHVQITVGETLGVENRGRTYEQMGALRDILQNHIMQLIATVAMEPPSAFDAHHVRNERIKVIEAIRPLTETQASEDFIRAQYIENVVDGRAVKGYRQENNVAPDSATETFVAGKFHVDTWRWSGVPFYIRTGKRLASRVTEISIHFNEPPMQLFRDSAETPPRNVLAMRIQPDEGISLGIDAKRPGVTMQLEPVQMDFSYAASFGEASLADAYEALLLDVIHGDPMLFARSDMHDAAWAALAPVLSAWEDPALGALDYYPSGTWGPRTADDLMKRDGRAWRAL
jgi:glucose-6-phosphate 1-dehydrogenase